MAITSKTLDAWVKRAIANFRTSFDGWPLGDKKFLGRVARSLGLIGWQLNKAVEDVDRDIVPSKNSSDDALDAWAFELGLPDGQGGYGRLKPVAATGGVASLTGVLGTSFSNGLIALAEDGTTQVKLDGAVSIAGSPPGFGSVSGQFVAVTAGAASNLAIGSVLTWQSPPAGADASFTLTSPLEGGADTENNPAVFARIVARLQTPPRGGVSEDYRVWASTVEGITAWVYPRRSGTGSVDLVITQAGTGQGRRPTVTQQTEVEDYITDHRPAGVEGVTVYIAYAPDANGHTVRVRVVPSSSRYDFDWDDTAGGPFTVDTGGYAAGPPATLRLNTTAPTTLTDAIDTYKLGNGLAPRLQVMSTGRPVNEPIRAVDYVTAAGKTTLTLESVPSTWTAPTSGDTVYAYGPAVETIANGILALCDALGPSRIGGYGDPITPWQDILTIASIIAVAEIAIDTDGTRLIFNVPVGNATIDGSAADVRGGDDPTNGPELLWLKHVAVTA